MKFGLSTVLKAASLLVGGIGLILAQALDSQNQKELKSELKEEILNDLNNED